MNPGALREIRKKCIAGDPPACSIACPLGLDIRDFLEKVRSGLFAAAYKLFQNSAILPGVACHLCGEPCKNACIRREVDAPLSIRELELFCWKNHRHKPESAFYIPDRNKTVLVVGGSVSGLCCAARLARRGYSVTIKEATAKLGGSLFSYDDRSLPREVLLEDITRLTNLKFLDVMLQTPVYDLSDEEYDAILVSTGSESCIAKHALSDDVFYGGSLVQSGRSPLVYMRQSADLAKRIDSYLKVNKALPEVIAAEKTVFFPDINKIIAQPVINPKKQSAWTADEAKAEAARCIQCTCSNCADVCPMMRHYDKQFGQLITNIADTIESAQMDGSGRDGLHPIMSCTQCGACKEVCPADIDTGDLCLRSRSVLHNKQQLPDVHYQYWLDDMAHANSKNASIFLPAKNTSSAAYIYFPGCQMGASNPAYVHRSYEWLLSNFSINTDMLLRCCGAPALWAGDTQDFDRALGAIRSVQENNNNPTFIVACPTCKEILCDYLPECKTMFIWEIMADKLDSLAKKRETISVFDPCSSRNDVVLKNSIRMILNKSGYDISELNRPDGEKLCCGYGGLVYTTTPELVKDIRRHNSMLGEYPYVTYCTNCKDSFLSNGKTAYHILDILFQLEVRSPSLTSRRENRGHIKQLLANKYLDTGFEPTKNEYDDIALSIPLAVLKKMEEQLVIEDNIKQVIHHARESGAMLYDSATGIYTAHTQQGKITFWVQYRLSDDTYIIENVYSHRLEILEVLNGL